MKTLIQYFKTTERKKIYILLLILVLGGAVFFAQPVDEALHSETSEESVVEAPQSDEAAAEAVPNGDVSYEFALKPHKALYNIDLIATRSGSQIVNISGNMFYEWYPSCEAWISNHRFDLLYEYADSAPMRITSDFSTYETFDGKNLDFTSRRKRDGVLFEELRGNARIKETGVGEAVYSKPEGLEHDLPRGTVFPLAHSRHLLRQIEEGRILMSLPLFDGSDDKGAVSVNSFIGKPVNAMAQINGSVDLDMTLLNTPAWQARLAFFPLDQEEAALADYEMDIVFHQNGIISDMVIDYDDFSISQSLKALEPLQSDCMDETQTSAD